MAKESEIDTVIQIIKFGLHEADIPLEHKNKVLDNLNGAVAIQYADRSWDIAIPLLDETTLFFYGESVTIRITDDPKWPGDLAAAAKGEILRTTIQL